MAGLFDRTDEHAMLHDTLRRFVSDQSGLEQRNQRLRAMPPSRLALWAPLAALGAPGSAIPEDRGGFGGSGRDLAVVQDAVAPGLLVEPLLACAIAARIMPHLARGVAAELEQGLISGRRIPVLAHAEGFDPFAPPSATAAPTADGFRLDGRKPCVRHADVATELLFTARFADGGMGIFLVPSSSNRLSILATRLIDAAGAGDVVADDVRLNAAALLVSGANAAAAVTDALEWGLAGLCAETASLTQAANQATFAYLNTREQFGSRLAQFQALQHRAADMAMAHEAAMAMAETAVSALEQPPSEARSRVILAASLACDGAGRRVAHEAIQLFGAMGVSDELAVSHYGRRLAAIRSQIGGMDARAARLTVLEKSMA